MKRALLSTGCAWLVLSFTACSSTSAGDSDGSPGGSTGQSGSSASVAGRAGGTPAAGGSGGSTGGSAGAGATAGSGGTAMSSGAGAGTMGGGAGSGTLGGSGGLGAQGGSAGAAAGSAGAPLGGMSGGAGAGAGAAGTPPTIVEPALVTSAQGAYWKEGTFMEVTSGNADVTVNDATTYQTWDGFGGTFNEVGWAMLMLLTPDERSKAMTLLFGMDGARFAFGRVPIGASDYAVTRYTHDENAGDYTMAMFSVDHDKTTLIPYIQAALALNPAVRLWASPWTPPTWMKDNGAFDGGNMKDDAMVLKAHALYLARFVEEYEKLGIKIEAIHPQNEPGYETRYPSCLWTAALMNKYIRDYLGPTFAERNVTAQIYLGTMSNADSGKDGTIISTVTADSATMKFIKGFGLQWNMINSISSLKSRNLPIVQSEHKCGNYPWETSTFNANTPPNDHAYGVESWGLIRDWINAGATSYSAWNMVLDKDGHNSDMQRPWPQNALMWVDKNAKTLTITPAYHVFRHVSEFVDPGAKRVATMGGDALAFKNPDGTLVAIVFNSGAAKQAIVSIGGKKLQFDMPSNGWATVNVK
ncbi:MAG TPA: glycoside hydrolase family 30 beta sandwich domain-containing protein [Polyangiaceae bacterium]|nr:glycoside hydrolase family 30 beta sandwich domain-containing protein [Polyangiaceae bacterium]